MAGTELGSAFISVGLGTNSLAGDIKKAFGSAESSGASAGKSAGRGFGAAFGVAAAALGALGIGSFFKSAVSGAADLEQSMGAIDAVFKGSAGQIHEWATTAATDVGLSKNEFNELGTLIGAQLKNGGTAMEDIAPKTKDLITLGADLSSMFGGTASDAVGALSSALKGERDPIERYGVSLNQAKIDAEAAALGFEKVGGSLSAEANQAATLSLIMKQTADAHGNFGRETDTLAHKQQVLAAQFADGKSRIGTELLPAVTSLTGAFSKALGPAINGTVGLLRNMNGSFSAFSAAFKANDGDITSSGFNGFMERLGFAVREVTGGFTAMFAAFKAGDGDVTSSGFAGFMERVGNAAREVTGGITAMFAAFKAGDGDVTSSGFAGVMEKIGNAARGVFDAIGPAISAIMPSLLSLVPPLFALFQALSPTSLIFQALLPVLPQIAAAIGAVVSQVLPLAVTLAGQLIPIITQLVASILPPLINIFANVVSAIAPLVAQIAGVLIPIIEALMPVVVTVFAVIASVITAAMQTIQGIIQIVTGIITGNWRQVWDGVVNTVSGALRLVGNVLGGLFSIVTSALGGVGGWLVDSGKALIGGFIDGIKGMVGGIKDAVGGVLQAARDLFPFSPAKEGPFSGRGYTTFSGAALAGDFADSIEGQKAKVAAAALAVTSAATLSGSYALGGSGAGSGPAGNGYNLPSFNVFIGNEQLDSRMFAVADSAISAADSQSQFSRRGR